MNGENPTAPQNITGANLKRIRETNNMTVEKLGELTLVDLNLSVDDILAIESKNHVVYDYELMYFSKLFNVTIDQFFD